MKYLAGSMTPMIPAMITAAMFRTLQTILGPDLLGVITPESSLYILFDMLYNAFFYFLSLYIGYTASKQLGVNVIMGMFAAGALMVPQFMNLVDTGVSFSVYGIPAPVSNYSQTLLPMLLTIWCMSYIEKFFRRHVPDMLSTVFVPFLTMADFWLSQ